MAAKYSKLYRIYFQDPLSFSQRLAISGDKFNYFKNVLRVKIGEEFRIFNETSGEFLAKIVEVGRKELKIEIIEMLREVSAEVPLTLALAMIKPERMLEAIRGAVQLGVTRIIPINTQYTQVKELNYDRTMRCILEATEQCERLVPPVLDEAIALEDFAARENGQIVWANERADDALSVVPDPDPESNRISNLKILDNPFALVGPEGGFSPNEISFLQQRGNVHSVSLGANVLRAEIAAITVLAIINEVRT